jgi:hypothetical protein
LGTAAMKQVPATAANARNLSPCINLPRCDRMHLLARKGLAIFSRQQH